jgi:DNA-binding CsgD family transcriptional regulator
MRLAAAGRNNSDIAATLSLSIRTVEQHLSNAYLKLGVGGRAGRAAAVANLVRRGLA